MPMNKLAEKLTIRELAGLGALMLLSACATQGPALGGHLSKDFGASTQSMVAQQAIAPTAEQKENTYIPPNTARQKLAIETYEAGEVELERGGTQ